MVDKVIKTLAEENGMKLTKGVAYGSLRGYAATLSFVNCYQIAITTRFESPEMQEALRQELNSSNAFSEFKVQNIFFSTNSILVLFRSGLGVDKKFLAFIDWFMPLLPKYQASRMDICTECGLPIADSGSWILRDGNIAFHTHSACAQKLQQSTKDDYARQQEEDTGSYARGALGALIGALLGGVLWAVVYMLGYIAGIVGLVIGFLAAKGYDLLRGKQGKGKIVILILVTLISVILGQFGGLVISTMREVQAEGVSITIQQTIELIFIVFQEDSAVLLSVLKDLALGIFFAFLGIFGLLRKTTKEVSAEKIVTLE